MTPAILYRLEEVCEEYPGLDLSDVMKMLVPAGRITNRKLLAALRKREGA
jgi:hypothetical protein